MQKLNKALNLHSLNRTAGLWCNGNTTVFGAVFLGSSPSRPTEKPLRNERLFLFKKDFLKNLHKLNKVLILHPLNSTAGLWCNGNTTVFGAVFLGSSPSRPT